jgi:succinate dehydrogenase / fumarate reductase membrane anchor subunit
VRAPGSAHAGLGEWLVQRATSIYLAGFLVYLALRFALDPLPDDHASFRAWFAQGAVRIAWGLFFLSLLAHAWVGLRSIYMDYLHRTGLRVAVTFLTGFGLLALALWAANILLDAAL